MSTKKNNQKVLSGPLQTVSVPEFSPIYDIELGDFDLDGNLDIYIADGDSGGTCSGCVQNRFYRNNLAKNISYNNFENGLGNWTQGQSVNSDTDSHDWLIHEGRTPSFSTGPDRAKSGDSYLYLESSIGNAFRPGDTAFLNSPTFLIDKTDFQHTLTFDYPMYGSDIGSLHIDVLSPDGFADRLDVFVLERQQQIDDHAAWKTASVNLTNHLASLGGSSFKIRIRAVAARTLRSDIAIDNLMITNANSR